jgi:hypothetical protein
MFPGTAMLPVNPSPFAQSLPAFILTSTFPLQCLANYRNHKLMKWWLGDCRETNKDEINCWTILAQNRSSKKPLCLCASSGRKYPSSLSPQKYSLLASSPPFLISKLFYFFYSAAPRPDLVSTHSPIHCRPFPNNFPLLLIVFQFLEDM